MTTVDADIIPIDRGRDEPVSVADDGSFMGAYSEAIQEEIDQAKKRHPAGKMSVGLRMVVGGERER